MLDWRWWLAILLLAITGLCFYLMRPGVAGLLYDDGMYLMTAKALASGQGYRLMGIEGQPWFYKYPPLYPLCLAGVWLINPHFPANIPWLKTCNILFFISSLAVLAYHFRRNLEFPPGICLTLLACLGFNWHILGLTTELMTEPLFLLLTSGTIALAHHYDRQTQSKTNRPPTPLQLFLLILLSVAAFYTRTMGIVLFLALAVWLWLKKQRKATLIYTALSSLLLLPWFLWSATKPNTTYSINHFLIRSFQETYFESFKMDLLYEFNFLELYSKGIQELLGNFSIHFFPILGWLFRGKATVVSESLILGSSFGLLLFIGKWAFQSIKTRKLSLSGLYICLYMLILPSWSYFKIYPRFMLVLLPFLLAAFIQAIYSQQWSQRIKHSATGAFLMLILATNVTQLWPYTHKPVPNTLLFNPYYDVWSNYQTVFKFLNEKTKPKAVIYNDNIDENYLYALNTNATVLDLFIFYPKALLDQHCGERNLACVIQHMQQRAELLYQLLQQRHVEYVVYQRFSIHKDPVNNWTISYKNLPPIELLLKSHPSSFIPVMQTADGWIQVFRFQPAASNGNASLEPKPDVKND